MENVYKFYNIFPAGSSSPSSAQNSPDELLFQCTGSEIVPKETLVRVNSKSEGPAIFVVSAIEGMVTSLKSLANELDRPVWGLQCTKDTPLESIGELAEFYVKQMRAVQKQGPYRLVGYSFGALVGFEMALQLENAGETVNLTLLDGSPEFITQHTQTIGHLLGKEGESLETDGTRKALAYFTRQINSTVGYMKVKISKLF